VSHFEQVSGAFGFSPGWWLTSAPKFSGGSARTAGAAGASVNVLFEGPEVRVIGMTGPDRGVFRVLIDGVDHGTVDTFAGDRFHHREVLFSESGLSDGPHVLELANVGREVSASYVTVDAVEAVGVVEMVRFEQSASAFVFSSGWWTAPDNKFSGFTARAASGGGELGVGGVRG
jgi:hypothetical protein